MQKKHSITIKNKITNPAELRSIMLGAMEALLEGRINVARANALAGLSAEVHKSIAQEWDMRCYAAETLHLEAGQVMKLLDAQVN